MEEAPRLAAETCAPAQARFRRELFSPSSVDFFEVYFIAKPNPPSDMIRLHSTLLKIALTLVAAHALSTPARADIIVVAPTATEEGSFTITSDITFTIETQATAKLIFLDQFLPASTSTTTQSNMSPDLAFSINGNPAITQAVSFRPHLGSGSLADDGFLILSSGFALNVGDTLTLMQGTYDLAIKEDFPALATQTFTGDMFVTNDSTTPISDTVSAAVPEPSAWALGAAGLAALGLVHRLCVARAIAGGKNL
jgi:hypothetical protein